MTLETIFESAHTIAQRPALALPTLWIHGEEDPLAPYDVTRDAVDRLRADQILQTSYPGAKHEIFNETNQDEVIGDMLAFIDGQLSRA